MKIAIYARVSTEKQDTENQSGQLRDFARKQDWTVAVEYTDYESGAKSDREQFQKMLSDASRHKFDLVLFWSLDRLSREGALKTLQYLNQLEGYNVGFRSFTEQYLDSTGLFRDAVISILATIAKQERIRRAERTRAGLARVRAAGRILGRPKMIHAYSADIVRLRTQGTSLRAIGKALGISERSVRRMIA
jgi:DNA invertase Pin-like site-specific DNA recombinase